MGYKMKIIFTNSNTIGSKIIRWKTKSKWSHVGIVDLKRQVVFEAVWPDGVVQTPLDKVIARSNEWECRELPVEHYGPAIAYMVSQLGKPYDTLGVLGLGFNRNWQDDKKWWCSEYVAMVALQGAIRGFPVICIQSHHKTYTTQQRLFKWPRKAFLC